jgi:hypothetical protein
VLDSAAPQAPDSSAAAALRSSAEGPGHTGPDEPAHVTAAAAAATAAAEAAQAQEAGEDAAAAALTASELDAHLAGLWQQQQLEAGEEQQQQGLPPFACLTWADAVRVAAGDWDLELNLLDPAYREAVQEPQRPVHAPAEYDAAAVAAQYRYQRLQQQQQAYWEATAAGAPPAGQQQ